MSVLEAPGRGNGLSVYGLMFWKRWANAIAMSFNEPTNDAPKTEPPAPELPERELPVGEFAIVELFGHTTLVGRVEEVQRFGATMLALEPLFRDTLLPAVFHGRAAIYRFTPCTAAVAWARQPRRAYQLPDAVRAIVPPLLLAAGDTSRVADVEDHEAAF